MKMKITPVAGALGAVLEDVDPRDPDLDFDATSARGHSQQPVDVAVRLVREEAQVHRGWGDGSRGAPCSPSAPAPSIRCPLPSF